MSRTPQTPLPVGLHVAIIMDGNGRWAESRRLPRIAGHKAGAENARRLVEGARRLGVGTLSLYAFSSDNWQRPGPEVGALMLLFRQYLASETPRCIANGIRMSVIGRRDRLPPEVLAAIAASESATATQRGMHLRIALDYSARDCVAAAAALPGAGASTTAFTERLGEVMHNPGPAPDVDLLVRSGGEKRLSDFLLWECAYAELWFTERMWPDFTVEDLERALTEFARRERRFGRVSPEPKRASGAGTSRLPRSSPKACARAGTRYSPWAVRSHPTRGGDP